jgi:hypothetical protein
MQAENTLTTRRALFAGGAGLAALALPAVALASTEDAKFIEWQRQSVHWYVRANTKGHTDAELDADVDRQMHYEDLILETPGQGVTAARIKAETLFRHARDFEVDAFIAPLASIVATLKALG